MLWSSKFRELDVCGRPLFANPVTFYKDHLKIILSTIGTYSTSVIGLNVHSSKYCKTKSQSGSDSSMSTAVDAMLVLRVSPSCNNTKYRHLYLSVLYLIHVIALYVLLFWGAHLQAQPFYLLTKIDNNDSQ